MNRRQADRSVIASRIVLAPSTDHGTVGTNPGHRVQTPVTATGGVRNRKSPRLTATQKDSTGRRSDWSRSPYYFTDPAWGLTVSHPVR